MFLLAAITVAIFGLGYWSASMRLKQMGGAALPASTKVLMGIMGLLFAFVFVAADLIATSLLGVLLAEFFVLCLGQVVGYILSGKSKKA